MPLSGALDRSHFRVSKPLLPPILGPWKYDKLLSLSILARGISAAGGVGGTDIAILQRQISLAGMLPPSRMRW